MELLKRLVVKLLKIGIIFSIPFLLLFIYIISYIEIGKGEVVENNFKVLKLEIENSKPLPENIYSIFKKADKNYYGNDFWNYVITTIHTGRSKKCECQKLASQITIKWKNHLDYFLKMSALARKLEKNFTQKQCFDTNVNLFDFLYEAKGISKASQIYFNKKVQELNEREIITIYLMLKNPILYNPRKRKERVDKIVTRIIENKLN